MTAWTLVPVGKPAKAKLCLPAIPLLVSVILELGHCKTWRASATCGSSTLTPIEGSFPTYPTMPCNVLHFSARAVIGVAPQQGHIRFGRFSPGRSPLLLQWNLITFIKVINSLFLLAFSNPRITLPATMMSTSQSQQLTHGEHPNWGPNKSPPPAVHQCLGVAGKMNNGQGGPSKGTAGASP